MNKKQKNILSALLFIVSAVFFYEFYLLVSNDVPLRLPEYNSTGGSTANGNTMSDDIYKSLFGFIFLVLWFITLRTLATSKPQAVLYFLISLPVLGILFFAFAILSFGS